MPFSGPRPSTPDEALQRLVEGNWRFRTGSLRREQLSPEWRQLSAQGQEPFAAVLTCSDSRLLAESILDCGFGDIFVCRVAGNLAGPNILASLEYAAEYLGVHLILVLGHERCGAVTAAADNEKAPGQIERLERALRPAVEIARQKPGDLIDNAVRANVELVAAHLRAAEPVLSSRIAAGTLRVEGAYYHLESGEVELLHC